MADYCIAYALMSVAAAIMVQATAVKSDKRYVLGVMIFLWPVAVGVLLFSAIYGAEKEGQGDG